MRARDQSAGQHWGQAVQRQLPARSRLQHSGHCWPARRRAATRSAAWRPARWRIRPSLATPLTRIVVDADVVARSCNVTTAGLRFSNPDPTTARSSCLSSASRVSLAGSPGETRTRRARASASSAGNARTSRTSWTSSGSSRAANRAPSRPPLAACSPPASRPLRQPSLPSRSTRISSSPPPPPPPPGTCRHPLCSRPPRDQTTVTICRESRTACA